VDEERSGSGSDGDGGGSTTSGIGLLQLCYKEKSGAQCLLRKGLGNCDCRLKVGWEDGA